eukprot:361589-Chlamydomonas_euryale.AAC.2
MPSFYMHAHCEPTLRSTRFVHGGNGGLPPPKHTRTHWGAHLAQRLLDAGCFALDHRSWERAEVPDRQALELVDEEGLKLGQQQQRLAGLAGARSAADAVHVLVTLARQADLPEEEGGQQGGNGCGWLGLQLCMADTHFAWLGVPKMDSSSPGWTGRINSFEEARK